MCFNFLLIKTVIAAAKLIIDAKNSPIQKLNDKLQRFFVIAKMIHKNAINIKNIFFIENFSFKKNTQNKNHQNTDKYININTFATLVWMIAVLKHRFAIIANNQKINIKK